jgi:hypothetical protein
MDRRVKVGGRWLLGKCQELGLRLRQQQYFLFEAIKGVGNIVDYFSTSHNNE